MSVRIGKEIESRIAKILFEGFPQTERGEILQKELVRYIPDMRKFTDEEIRAFSKYQTGIWLNHFVPTIGRGIASLNPTFVPSVDSIEVTKLGLIVYTRGSVKENGYRMQLHIGPQRGTVIQDVSAITRQFTPYDLRMFPELLDTLSILPVMIGDDELVNKHHAHLAGFNRVQIRIPNMHYWPKGDSGKLDDKLLEEYLRDCFRITCPIYC